MKGHKFRRPDAERITHSELSKRFAYDEKNGGLIRVKIIGSKAKGKTGRVKSTGYHSIQIDRKHYLTHHLVWFYHHNQWPVELDHMDRNKLNNRIENLKEVTRKENMQVLCRRVKCVETGAVYDSISSAAAALNRNILSDMSGISKSASRGGLCGGFHWEYA